MVGGSCHRRGAPSQRLVGTAREWFASREGSATVSLVGLRSCFDFGRAKTRSEPGRAVGRGCGELGRVQRCGVERGAESWLVVKGVSGWDGRAEVGNSSRWRRLSAEPPGCALHWGQARPKPSSESFTQHINGIHVCIDTSAVLQGTGWPLPPQPSTLPSLPMRAPERHMEEHHEQHAEPTANKSHSRDPQAASTVSPAPRVRPPRFQRPSSFLCVKRHREGNRRNRCLENPCS